MKKIIKISIFMLLTQLIKAQEIKCFGFSEDKVQHFGAGYLIGFSSNALAYKLLSEKTDMNLTLCKITSGLIGFGSGLLAGHLKEKHDNIYSKKDLSATCKGSFSGSITITFIIRKMKPRNRFTMAELYEIEKDLSDNELREIY